MRMILKFSEIVFTLLQIKAFIVKSHNISKFYHYLIIKNIEINNIWHSIAKNYYNLINFNVTKNSP